MIDALERLGWAARNRRVLAQLAVADKSNEITVVPQLLRALELTDCLVTMDALNCQKNIVKEISEADADYGLALRRGGWRRQCVGIGVWRMLSAGCWTCK